MDTETQETTMDTSEEFNQDTPEPTLDQKLAKIVKRARKSAKRIEDKYKIQLTKGKKGKKAPAAKAKAEKPAKGAKAAKKAKPAKPAKTLAKKDQPKAGAETKGDKIRALLGRPGGATMQQIMTATEWQPHSVRGFISTLHRKHKVNIVSEKNEAGVRVYSIG